MKIAAIVIALVSSFALGQAVHGLAGGVAEMPRHWWSTGPLLGLVLAAAIGLASMRKGRS